MSLSGFILSLGSAIIVLIFVILFVILTGKWSKKRLKEISGRFDSELDQLESKKKELKEIENEISELKKEKRGKSEKESEIIKRKIERLRKKKTEIHRFIDENY
ncbi:MAG: hypothetical protein GF368_02375 [Candidatus Aenigmarchaeota archaeon]|nr:hypothetical protein [Candidatus Aenigmarchaeota archaeon]